MKGDWRKDPILGDEGYPSTRELRRIKTWEIHSGQDLTELMDYVYARWEYREWGWRKASRLRVPWRGVNYADRKRSLVRVYKISTAGWSGNESIIAALEANFTFWVLSWESVRRGGHYVFHIRENYG